MKTKNLIIYTFIAMFTINNVKAQLPNSNFEDWALATNVTDSLIGWSSSNSVVTKPVVSLYKDTKPFQGLFSAHLATTPFGFVNYSTLGLLVNGSAKFSYGGGTGINNAKYISGGGTPISYKPNELKGFYKTTTTVKNNLPIAKILLSKFNTTTNKRDTVSYTEYNFAASSKYTSFSIPLVDLMPTVIPDSVTIIFYSSNPNTVDVYSVNEDFYLDSLELPKPITTSINDHVSSNLELEVFPNPTTGLITINLADIDDASSYVIKTMEGRIVRTGKTTKDKFRIDLGSESNGIYFISIVGDKTSSIHKVIKR